MEAKEEKEKSKIITTIEELLLTLSSYYDNKALITLRFVDGKFEVIVISKLSDRYFVSKGLASAHLKHHEEQAIYIG